MDFDLLTINQDIEHNIITTVLNIPETKVASRLVIVINTRGGSPFIAYRTMQHLGALYKKIDIVVPDMAMSAGTLMCMGADRIFMYHGSSLGPLDLQVPHPQDGGQISSLDIKDSTYDIFNLTAGVAKQFYAQAINDLKLGKVAAAKVAHESAVELLKPLIDKIDPFHLHASNRGASIGQKYAFLLLASRMLKKDKKQASITGDILANNYELHGYSITMEEARDYLQLVVDNIQNLDVLPLLPVKAIPDGITFNQVRIPPPHKVKEEEIKDEQKRTRQERE